MAKLSLAGVKRPKAEELLRGSQPDIVSDHDTDLAGSDYGTTFQIALFDVSDKLLDQQSVDLGDSPSEQLRRENTTNAAMSKEGVMGVQCMPDTPEDVADGLLRRSAMILNSAIQERSTHTSGELAPAIIQPSASPTKKRTIGSDAIQSPSKRLRGRPTRAAAAEQPIRPLSRTTPSSGRLKRPRQIPIRNGGNTAKARIAEEIYEVPEDSPLKPTKSSLTIQENNDAVQESREDTTDNHSRSVLLESTTEPKKANIITSELPRKRGRPPKGNTKSSSQNEEKNSSVFTHANVSQSGSSLQSSDKPEESANTTAEKKGLTKRLNGKLHGKGKPTIEEPSVRSRSASVELVARHVSVPCGMTPVQASEVSTEVIAPLDQEDEASRTEKQEEAFNDDDPDFVGEQSGEIEDNFEDQSDLIEPQEDVNNVLDVEERSDDRGSLTIAAGLKGEAGRAAKALEIFGADERWKRILQAARSVGLKKGRSLSSERRVGHNIAVLSNTIKKFLQKVMKVGLCYQQASSMENTNTESQHNLRLRPRNYTLWLESAIEKIRPSKEATKNVERIQDVYVHAVPQMVILLKDALNAQPALYSADEEIESLKHVLDVQSLVIQLCKKVGSWSESAKKKGQVLPITDLPIKAATSRRILPYLRDIGETVKVELDSIREEARRTEEESARLAMYHAREARWQAKREKNRVEREQKQRQAAEDVLRLSGGQLVSNVHRQYRQNPLEIDQWTEDQDRELLRLLWDLGDLPGMHLCSTCPSTLLCLHTSKRNGAILSHSILPSSKISCRNILRGELLR